MFCPQFIAEFDLRSVQYEVKSSRCHEMRLAAPPHDCISFNFRCDREAEEWATVVMSSLREAHRGEAAMSMLLAFVWLFTAFTWRVVWKYLRYLYKLMIRQKKKKKWALLDNFKYANRLPGCNKSSLA